MAEAAPAPAAGGRVQEQDNLADQARLQQAVMALTAELDSRRRSCSRPKRASTCCSLKTGLISRAVSPW